jgi:hypothetical protein
MAPGSGTAGNSEGIALAESVALAEDMAEVGRLVSAEDIAEGIGSFRLATARQTSMSEGRGDYTNAL